MVGRKSNDFLTSHFRVLSTPLFLALPLFDGPSVEKRQVLSNWSGMWQLPHHWSHLLELGKPEAVTIAWIAVTIASTRLGQSPLVTCDNSPSSLWQILNRWIDCLSIEYLNLLKNETKRNETHQWKWYWRCTKYGRKCKGMGSRHGRKVGAAAIPTSPSIREHQPAARFIASGDTPHHTIVNTVGIGKTYGWMIALFPNRIGSFQCWC